MEARCQAPEVARFVRPRLHVAESRVVERGPEPLVLRAADLHEQPAAFAKQTCRGDDDAANDVEAVAASVEREWRLVAPDVGGKQPELLRGNVGSDGADDIERVRSERLSEIGARTVAELALPAEAAP